LFEVEFAPLTRRSTLLLAERWRRATVVGRLAKAAATTVPTLGRPREQDLTNLIQLGRQSHPGEDKRLVLDALHHLATAVHRSGKYDGAQLKSLIAGIDEIVVSSPEVGSPRNFQFSADLLMNMILNARGCEHSDDLRHAIQMTSLVAQAALSSDHLDVQARFVEALAAVSEAQPESDLGRRRGFATWASQALFEIGSLAADIDGVLVAMACLSKLDTIAQNLAPVEGELAYDILGLVAHFWGQGPTGKKYVRPILDDAEEIFASPLSDVLNGAADHFTVKSRFRTVEYLGRIRTEYVDEETFSE